MLIYKQWMEKIQVTAVRCHIRHKRRKHNDVPVEIKDVRSLSKWKQEVLRYTDAMFLHEGDELSLSQIVGGVGLLFHQFDLVHCERVSTLTGWQSLFQRDALPRHHRGIPCTRNMPSPSVRRTLTRSQRQETRAADLSVQSIFTFTGQTQNGQTLSA